MAGRPRKGQVTQSGGGGGGRPLLQFASAMGGYNPNISITPGQEYQGPVDATHQLPQASDATLNINPPTFGERLLTPGLKSK